MTTNERTKAVSKLADVFKQKAMALSCSDKPEGGLFDGDAGHEYLMEAISALLQKDEWDDSDAAKLSALFFFLLVSDADDGEEESEGSFI